MWECFKAVNKFPRQTITRFIARHMTYLDQSHAFISLWCITIDCVRYFTFLFYWRSTSFRPFWYATHSHSLAKTACMIPNIALTSLSFLTPKLTCRSLVGYLRLYCCESRWWKPARRLDHWRMSCTSWRRIIRILPLRTGISWTYFINTMLV